MTALWMCRPFSPVATDGDAHLRRWPAESRPDPPKLRRACAWHSGPFPHRKANHRQRHPRSWEQKAACLWQNPEACWDMTEPERRSDPQLLRVTPGPAEAVADRSTIDRTIGAHSFLVRISSIRTGSVVIPTILCGFASIGHVYKQRRQWIRSRRLASMSASLEHQSSVLVIALVLQHALPSLPPVHGPGASSLPLLGRRPFW